MLPDGALAQQYELGLTGAATGYMGDINNTDPLYYNNAGGGLFAKYNLTPTWGFRASFHYLPIYGNDHDFKNKDRGLLFNNDIKEVSLTGEFNFFRFIPGTQANRYTPYLLGGVAVIHHDPYVYYSGDKTYLRKYELESDQLGNHIEYSSWAISIPIGAGFRYNIRGPWTVGAEINYRTVLSDDIDGVAQYYNRSAKNPLLADPTGRLSAREGTLRGNGKKLDGYMTAGLTLTYTLFSARCNWWH